MNIDWHGKASVSGVSESTSVLLQSRRRSEPENVLESTTRRDAAGKASSPTSERERLDLLGEALARISHTKKAHRGAESAKVVLRERL
jgi:hypothetical protein